MVHALPCHPTPRPLAPDRGARRRLFPALALLATLLLLGSPGVRAGTEAHEPSGLRVVWGNDWLQALDPRDGRVAWQRRLRGSSEATVRTPGPDLWLLAAPTWLEAFEPGTGKRLWRHEGSERLWGPEIVGPEVWTAERGEPGGPPSVRLSFRELSTGVEVWYSRQALDLVAARVWGTDLAVRLKPFPSAPAGSKYLRLPTPVGPAPPERLVVFDARGGLRWSCPLGPEVEGGPWTSGEVVMTAERDPAGRYLAARFRGTGAPAWTLPLGGPLAADPEDSPAGLRLQVRGREGTRVQVIAPKDGKPVWSFVVPGDLALDPLEDGGRLVLVSRVPEAEGPVFRTRVDVLDARTGRPAAEPVVTPGLPLQALPLPGRLILALKATWAESAPSPAGSSAPPAGAGRPTRGFSLVEIRPGSAARTLAGDAGDELVEPSDPASLLEPVDGLLLYATRQPASPASGVGGTGGPAPVLHALDLAAGRERWAWKGPEPLEPGWAVREGTLFAATSDRSPWTGSPRGRLLALDPATGAVRWRSPRLKGLPGAPDATPSGLFVLTSADQACLVDPRTGALLAAHDLVPLFNWTKWNNLAGVLLLTGCIAWFIFHARRRELFIRRIAGLDALDEAVGRSTEMGRPVLYVPGLADVDDIQTLASLSILGHVARRTAEYDTPILVPNSRSVVMSMAQEVVREAYVAAGRPEAFQPDQVRYLSDEQFGYAAGVSGLMLRERPAANFYMGTFFAEALILAETGNATGAIQIAGTASASQLPFFVAACDYTLIGEELYAASAWLSRDPMQVGSLKGQDAAKAVLMASILVGTLLVSLGLHWIKELWITS